MLIYKNTQIKYGLVLQIVSIIALSLFLFMYILPRYTTIGERVDATNALIWEYQSLKEKGIAYGSLVTVWNRTNKTELVRLTQNYAEDVKKAIVKPATIKGEYIKWINSEIEKADATEIKKKFAFMNSIIPTLHKNELFWEEEEPITLSALISYVEGNILWKFGITSTSPIGIQNITFVSADDPDMKANSTTGTIGYFDILFAIEARNSDIQDMIAFIEKSWQNTEPSPSDPNTPLPWVMSNALITIETLSLNSVITSQNQGEMNELQMTLRFYVRGASQKDIVAVKDRILSDIKKLSTALKTLQEKCDPAKIPCDELEPIVLAVNSLEKNANTLVSSQGNEVTRLNILSQVTASLSEVEAQFDIFKKVNKIQ